MVAEVAVLGGDDGLADPVGDRAERHVVVVGDPDPGQDGVPSRWYSTDACGRSGASGRSTDAIHPSRAASAAMVVRTRRTSARQVARRQAPRPRGSSFKRSMAAGNGNGVPAPRRSAE